MKTPLTKKDAARLAKLEAMRVNAQTAIQDLSCHYRGQQVLKHLRTFIKSPDGVMGLDDWSPVATIIEAYQNGLRDGLL
jgi:hypothetical protein